MIAPFFLGISLLLIAPAAGSEISYTGKELGENREIRLKDDKYDALVIENIYADVIYVSPNDKPGSGDGRVSAEVIQKSGTSRNKFRIDLTSLKKGTYYIHTSACYAQFCYRLILK